METNVAEPKESELKQKPLNEEMGKRQDGVLKLVNRFAYLAAASPANDGWEGSGFVKGVVGGRFAPEEQSEIYINCSQGDYSFKPITFAYRNVEGSEDADLEINVSMIQSKEFNYQDPSTEKPLEGFAIEVKKIAGSKIPWKFSDELESDKMRVAVNFNKNGQVEVEQSIGGKFQKEASSQGIELVDTALKVAEDMLQKAVEGNNSIDYEGTAKEWWRTRGKEVAKDSRFDKAYQQ